MLTLQPALFLLICAPVLEELVFRTGLHEQLLSSRVAPAFANLATALVFALVHALTRSWWLGLAVFVPATCVGWLYQRQRRVLPCVLAHSGMNLVWLLLALTAPVGASSS